MENVLCGGNAGNMKYYFNEEKFGSLPGQVKDELKILIVKFLSDVGGAATLSFGEDHNLQITTYEPVDEIGAELKVKQMQEENLELFSQLELYHKTFFS